MSRKTELLRFLDQVTWTHSAQDPKNIGLYCRIAGFAGKAGPGVHYIYNRQVHGTAILEAKSGVANASQDGDGVWSAQNGEIVAVRTADCLPILLCDRDRKIAMAVHAGWRGLTAGILNEAIKVFRAAQIQPENIITAIGPAISREKYEVGPEVVEALFTGGAGLSTTAAAISIAKGRADRWYLDLQVAAALNLFEQGVSAENMEAMQVCTYQSSEFFSYRRDGKGVGSNIAYIGL